MDVQKLLDEENIEIVDDQIDDENEDNDKHNVPIGATVNKNDVCVVITGNVDAGKSSFLGVICSGELDDGKGSARNKIAKHPHEIATGKTSDISTKTITYNDHNLILVDLCGHEKYLKTTLFGITGYFPDYGILIVSANRGFLKMTKEHMGILLYMKIPFIILITRIDITPKNIYDNVMGNTIKILKTYKRTAEIINDYQSDEESGLIKIKDILPKFKNNPYIVPVISISNKTGYYINVVRHTLENLEPRNVWDTDSVNGSIFYIDSKYVPIGVGLVITGLVKGNPINVGSEMLIGPYGNEFKRVKVWSMHDNNRNNIQSLNDRQRGCLAIKAIDKKEEINKNSIRKGMIVVSKEIENNICYQFTAEIEILSHSGVIASRYTPVIHCGTVRQSARMTLNNNQTLKLGDKEGACIDWKKARELGYEMNVDFIHSNCQ